MKIKRPIAQYENSQGYQKFTAKELQRTQIYDKMLSLTENKRNAK